MRTNRFTPEEMVMALRQAEGGTPVEEVCRKLGISDATFHRWRKRFGTLRGAGGSGAAPASG